MRKEDKERKEYQQALVNMEKAFHTFDNSIAIMTNAIDFANMTTSELNEITGIVLKIAKACKKVAEDAKKHKQQHFSEKDIFDADDETGGFYGLY